MDASLLQRIDFIRLTMNLGGNKHAIKDMLELFLKSATESLKKVEAAEKAGDAAQWARVIHHMKGAAQNITAKRLVSLCLEAEAITTLPHEQASAVLYHMHKELALLNEAITKHLGASRHSIL